MTPLQITMMLHYYACGSVYAKHEPEHAGSAAVREQRAALISSDLLEPDDSRESGYRVTGRGAAYVEGLKNMQLPVCRWVIAPHDEVVR